ncbi:MAG TPA: hypothetical protein P5084_06435 [Paludibacter sp.]|nr:hypothetical protein [Paludibacter sp.]
MVKILSSDSYRNRFALNDKSLHRFILEGVGWRLRRQPTPSKEYKVLIVISNGVRNLFLQLHFKCLPDNNDFTKSKGLISMI